MVLGLKAKNRRSPSVQVDYLIHVQEIKPWPPSQSLRSLRSVLIQWENGDRNSGSTNLVVPSLGSVIGEGRIEFNESFRLPVILLRDMSVKGGDADTFQKNCLELNLYEPRRDKTVKGQLLGTAIIDLADYGLLKETASVSIPMNCKRNYRNTDQPILFIKIQPVAKGRTSSSSKNSLSKAASLDSNGGESVSALMNEEYAEEAEIASFTDDDVSSHSSLAASSAAFESNASLPPQQEQNGADVPNNNTTREEKDNSLPSEVRLKIAHESTSSDLGNPGYDNTKEKSNTIMRTSYPETLEPEFHESLVNGQSVVTGNIQPNNSESSFNNSSSEVASSGDNSLVAKKSAPINCDGYQDYKVNRKYGETDKECTQDGAIYGDAYISSVEDKHENGSPNFEMLKKEEVSTKIVSKEIVMDRDTNSLDEGDYSKKGNILKNERLRHVKSVRSPADSARSIGSPGINNLSDVKEIGLVGEARIGTANLRSDEKKEAKIYPKEARSAILDSKVQQLEQKVKMLEGELREVAAIEAALYSVVAEHGSSKSKVHVPARRLSRLYLHACRDTLQSRKASAARSSISGLVLVAKACGNDVPRLTFWLSNAIMLRTIISLETTEDVELPLSAGPRSEGKIKGKENGRILSPLTWKTLSPDKSENETISYQCYLNWEDPHTFISALEKTESWIFSRIIESIWWQILTPHMHPVSAKFVGTDVIADSIKDYRRMSSPSDQDQGNFSLSLWKNAFRNACERLCPVRARGHECGCLPILPKLVMEQCVARLDVAMFNAILRESADEIPTDPVSDPINDPKVLPVPAGKSSFGAGAQLKNTIGNWSRWLANLFGMDDDDSLEDGSDDEIENTSFKPFQFLNALSDLYMLPKDMLLNRSIREEVCPMFGAPLIKRILGNFVPDEFCPDPIPDAVLEALDEEDLLEDKDEYAMSFPCTAAPIVYSPPPAASIASIVEGHGSRSHLERSGSSVIRKSYTSDDELDELSSPFSSILFDDTRFSSLSLKSSWKAKQKIPCENAVRFELLRDVWKHSE